MEATCCDSSAMTCLLEALESVLKCFCFIFRPCLVWLN